LWWSPDPRFVMYPKDIKVSKSMKQVFKKKEFTITIDQDFEGVVKKCQKMYRPGQYGTWITDDMLAAYCTLHQAGFAHSVETWDDDHNLVGGLYGMAIGKCFFGESMFAEVSNASKAAYVRLVQQLALWGFSLIDCQVYTKHLESLGAVKISRYLFLNQLENALQQPFKPGKWHFDEETP
jgi:leucyl/phenylalanyl-tRNA--protein transferase